MRNETKAVLFSSGTTSLGALGILAANQKSTYRIWMLAVDTVLILLSGVMAGYYLADSFGQKAKNKATE